MDLENFVKTTIVSILNATKKSGEELNLENEIFVGTKADKRCIEFDIAVSVEESKSKEGNAKIKVLEFVEGGGLFGKKVKNSTVSRIRFGVYTPDPRKNIKKPESKN